ncbi:MAG: hypothetical protein U0169_05300 [Polyangiaceae bacterium]
MADERIYLSETDEVDVAAAVMDFSSVDPTKRGLARARLWLLRRSNWGWARLHEIAAKVAAEEPKMAFWLKVEHEGDDVAVLGSVDGALVTIKPESVKDLSVKRLARSSGEAERVLKVLVPPRGADASLAELSEREREIVGDKLVEPSWPESETLKDGELVRGSSFTDFRIEGNHYMPERLVKDVTELATKLDRSMSYVVQKAYLRARDRIQRVTSRAELPKPPPTSAPNTTRLTEKRAVFLVMPSWMALEVERKAAQIDCSKSMVVTAAVVLGLPEIATEK